jgi:hypothetical protein
MIIGVCQLTLQLYASDSLKEKRRVVRAIVDRTRSRFNVAIAEVDDQDVWESCVIGISCVSTDTRHANSMLDKVTNHILGLALEMDVIDRQLDFIPFS